ncbi:uncharacterized protein [Dendropsophus ebraccatus]|uniref:uncharacterized protein n=1 Tax=Dendropsophus ebraccatus TaxID=150705 RepID=UPI003831144E
MSSRVRIFSRSGESEYRWLVDILREKWTVSPFIITNNNYSLFREEINKCSFAILYHSRNRGRVNVTDVTDSLYDEEVRAMSEALGKDRVIAVIDDLEDSSEETKKRILGHQPSLRTLTRDIFLFTAKDKMTRWKAEQIIRIISSTLWPEQKKIDVPDQDPRPREESNPSKNGGMKTMVLLLSCLVFWNTYYSPTRRNGLLAALWVAAMARTFYARVSEPALPLANEGRLALSCAITFLTACDVYRGPSIYNVAVSTLWISRCFMYSQPRSWNLLSGPVRRALPYGLILLTFWKGWQHSDAETTAQAMAQGLLLSPAILVAEVI